MSPAVSAPPGSRLHLPIQNGVKVVDGIDRVAKCPRHADASAAGTRRRQFAIGARIVDPHVRLSFRHGPPAGGGFSRLGAQPSFASAGGVGR
jgi:hypothetical protein